jgi:hypothetical protein
MSTEHIEIYEMDNLQMKAFEVLHRGVGIGMPNIKSKLKKREIEHEYTKNRNKKTF